jgi:hypothetical protein
VEGRVRARCALPRRKWKGSDTKASKVPGVGKQGQPTHAANLGKAAGVNGHLQAGLAQGENLQEARRLKDLGQGSLVLALQLVSAVRVHWLKGRARAREHAEVKD